MKNYFSKKTFFSKTIFTKKLFSEKIVFHKKVTFSFSFSFSFTSQLNSAQLSYYLLENQKVTKKKEVVVLNDVGSLKKMNREINKTIKQKFKDGFKVYREFEDLF